MVLGDKFWRTNIPAGNDELLGLFVDAKWPIHSTEQIFLAYPTCNAGLEINEVIGRVGGMSLDVVLEIADYFLVILWDSEFTSTSVICTLLSVSTNKNFQKA